MSDVAAYAAGIRQPVERCEGKCKGIFMPLEASCDTSGVRDLFVMSLTSQKEFQSREAP